MDYYRSCTDNFFSVRQVQCLLCSLCLAASPWGGQIEKGGRGFLSLLDQTVKEQIYSLFLHCYFCFWPDTLQTIALPLSDQNLCSLAKSFCPSCNNCGRLPAILSMNLHFANQAYYTDLNNSNKGSSLSHAELR